ncbi:hypothetical protein [Tepidibacter hydrothermalis]|uniref:Uncharacterized protein n=1 Tax=Tepidibacter hydrothermalis TaxID=3036126 RepID=A0ABY8EGD1_9FIRM|nr:hypothetical protein [Tepidibacter hydrothermalis]WFD11988.1 hypothetical protein P4S50_07895 [Tepidibacter hydrothermalis]
MRASTQKNAPIRKIMNLIPGQIYRISIKHSNSYDLTDRAGRKNIKKKMKFIVETENLYVFENLLGLRECFAKNTPKGELEIKLA